MELNTRLRGIVIINIIINIGLGLPGTYLSFRRVSESAPARFIPAGFTVKPSLFGDFLVTAFLMGLILSWIMVAMARKMIINREIYVKEQNRLKTGAPWKTKGFLVGMIVAGGLCFLLIVISLPLGYFCQEAALSSLSQILVFKGIYAGILAGILTWIIFRMSARNQDAIK